MNWTYEIYAAKFPLRRHGKLLKVKRIQKKPASIRATRRRN